MTLVPTEPYVNKYEGLQVSLVVLLVVIHLMFYLMMLPGPALTLPGIAIGVLEIAVSGKMSSRLTFRATEAPRSVRSAFGGMRAWLLVIGVVTVIYSVGWLTLNIIVARFY